MARILTRRIEGRPASTLRRQVRQIGGRLPGMRILIKQDEAKGITQPGIQGATRVGGPVRAGRGVASASSAGIRKESEFSPKQSGGFAKRVRKAVPGPLKKR